MDRQGKGEQCVLKVRADWNRDIATTSTKAQPSTAGPAGPTLLLPAPYTFLLQGYCMPWSSSTTDPIHRLMSDSIIQLSTRLSG